MRHVWRLLSACVLALVPACVSAHAFGVQYTLPLPIEFYFLGGSVALIASFAILGLFSTPTSSHKQFKTEYVMASWWKTLFSAIGVVGLVVILVLAFFGADDFTNNPTPVLFWVVFLLGMTYFSALVGGVWERINPFRTLAELVVGKRHEPLVAYPEKLGYIPALIFYFGLIRFELLSQGLGAYPQNIGIVLVAYAMMSILGTIVFGAEKWLKYGDFFTVFFRLVGKFAPLYIEDGRIVCTLPGERLVHEQASRVSLLFFILFMLSSTAFDGILETAPWISLIQQELIILGVYQLFLHVALFISPLLFFVLYAFAVWLMKYLMGTTASLHHLLLRFAYSLVPIVVAYHFAHYFPLIFFQGQTIVPMLSDPLGLGWNVFGTADVAYNISIIGTQTIWYTQVVAIVIGHIFAAYIAHRIALRECTTRRQVIVGQLPMLALMVLYTVFGLWILSLPFGVGV